MQHQTSLTWTWPPQQRRAPTPQSPRQAVVSPHGHRCEKWGGRCGRPLPAACSCRPDTAGAVCPPWEAFHTKPSRCRCRQMADKHSRALVLTNFPWTTERLPHRWSKANCKHGANLKSRYWRRDNEKGFSSNVKLPFSCTVNYGLCFLSDI